MATNPLGGGLAPSAALPTRTAVCPILIGRSQHLASIQAVIANVVARKGQSASICGEAGIGKSRLVTEIRERMAASGALALPGHCFEHDASLPYAPLLDLMRSCLMTRTTEEMTECMGADAPELAKLLPELVTLIPSLVPAAPLEPEQEKRRIFLALAQFFGRLAAKQPLLITIEDMHWCDDTSLEFLLYAARRVATLPVLLLYTYRSDEVHPALGHFLAQLERERLVTEWSLGPLDVAQVEEMIRAIFELDAAVPDDFLNAIYSLTEGNPFFIEEVLKSLVASGDIFYADGSWDRKPLSELNIPRSVHDAVRVRTEQLSRDAQQLLTLAAVTGRRFDFGLLQQVSQREERDVLTLVKEMIAAQLVVEDSDDHFSFRHALTQHVIYGDLLVRERRALHRTIAENIQKRYAAEIDAHLADLAYHFYEAASWNEAYYYCRRVGEHAQTLYASGAAVEHLTRAIDAAQHLSVAIPARLFRARGQSYELIGEFERARSDYERALETARGIGEGLSEWQALIDLGALWAGRDYRRTGEFFRAATDLARALNEPTLIAQSLNRLGNWLVNTGQPEEGLSAHHDALLIFESCGDEAGRASTLDLIGMGNGLKGDMAASFASFDAAIELFRKLGDNQGLVSSLSSRGTYGTPSMHDVSISPIRTLEETSRDTKEALDLARRIGWRAGRAYAEFTACAVYTGFGQIDEAIQHGNESLRIAAEIDHEQWQVGARFALAQTYLSIQTPDLAAHHLEEALPSARRVGSEWWLNNVSSYLALAYLMQGLVVRARAVLFEVMPEHHAPATHSQRRMTMAWGELALSEARPEHALELAERVLRTVPGDRSQLVPTPLRLRARALVALGRTDEAEGDLLAAETAATARAERLCLWQIQRDLARLYIELRRQDQAASKADASRSIVEAIAGTIADQRLKQQFLEAAAIERISKRPPSLRQAEKAAFGGLTAREREVAALIAEGKTNRDIADELVLGERTIETHVGNILSKLQFSSRAQVAAWAVQVHLPARQS